MTNPRTSANDDATNPATQPGRADPIEDLQAQVLALTAALRILLDHSPLSEHRHLFTKHSKRTMDHLAKQLKVPEPRKAAAKKLLDAMAHLSAAPIPAHLRGG